MRINFFGKEIELQKSTTIVLGILLVSGITTVGVIINKNSEQVTIMEVGEQETSSSFHTTQKNLTTTTGNKADDKTDATSDGQNEEIRVHITGSVKKPGVITLKKGQIIQDAISAAGGGTPDADLDSINLVYKLEENVKIHIRKKGEIPIASVEQPKDSGGTSSAAKSVNSHSEKQSNNAGIEVKKDSGGAIVGESIGTSGSKSSGKININTASLEELNALPGVGDVTAQKIITYREKNGKFESIEDLKNVSGIGESKFNKLKESITVK